MENKKISIEHIHLCCICLEPLEAGFTHTMKCHHSLCKHCFQTLKNYQLSLSQDVTCPQCRSIEIKSIEPTSMLFFEREPYSETVDLESLDSYIYQEMRRRALSELYKNCVNGILCFCFLVFVFITFYWFSLTHCSLVCTDSFCRIRNIRCVSQ